MIFKICLFKDARKVDIKCKKKVVMKWIKENSEF